MDKKTFGDPVIAKKLENDFVFIKLNPEKPQENIQYKGESLPPMQFAQRAGLRGFPYLAFLDEKGDFITALPGFVQAPMFNNVLDYISAGCYKRKVPFNEFVKKGTCN